MKSITVRFSDTLHKNLKLKLVYDERTFQEYMISLVEADLKRCKKTNSKLGPI